MTCRELLLNYLKDKDKVTSRELVVHAISHKYSMHTAYNTIRYLVYLGVLRRIDVRRGVGGIAIYEVDQKKVKELLEGGKSR